MPSETRYLISNDVNATPTNALGNNVSCVFENTLSIPPEAKNIRCYCQNASVVNYFNNISSLLNNNIIYWTDDSGDDDKYTLTITNGAYETSTLNLFLKNYFTNNGYLISGTTEPFKFIENVARQRVVLQLENGRGVKFPTNIANLLGFATTPIFNSTGTTAYYEAPNITKYNTVISLILSLSCITSTLYAGKFTNMISKIPINAPVGSLVNYAPNFPLKITQNQLAGANISQVNMSIRDQNNRDIEIQEVWDATFVFEWDI